jgi:hypothetical protein
VKPVKSGHHKVETEEDELILDRIAFMRIELARQQSFIPLVVVLERLNDKEDSCADKRDQQIPDQRFLLVRSGGVNRHHHRKTRKQQNNCIQSAEALIEMMMGREKRFRVRCLL